MAPIPMVPSHCVTSRYEQSVKLIQKLGPDEDLKSQSEHPTRLGRHKVSGPEDTKYQDQFPEDNYISMHCSSCNNVRNVFVDPPTSFTFYFADLASKSGVIELLPGNIETALPSFRLRLLHSILL